MGFLSSTFNELTNDAVEPTKENMSYSIYCKIYL